jgi:hypothetical protein
MSKSVTTFFLLPPFVSFHVRFHFYGSPPLDQLRPHRKWCIQFEIMSTLEWKLFEIVSTDSTIGTVGIFTDFIIIY